MDGPASHDNPPPSPSASGQTPLHQRRPRYAGRNPRRFEEKYKELNPDRYPEAVAHVLASGKTPAGMHVPIMVHEILDVLAPQPGETAVDCTLAMGQFIAAADAVGLGTCPISYVRSHIERVSPLLSM